METAEEMKVTNMRQKAIKDKVQEEKMSLRFGFKGPGRGRLWCVSGEVIGIYGIGNLSSLLAFLYVSMKSARRLPASVQILSRAALASRWALTTMASPVGPPRCYRTTMTLGQWQRVSRWQPGNMRKQRETRIRRAAAFPLWLSYLPLGFGNEIGTWQLQVLVEKPPSFERKSKCDTASAFSGWRHVGSICSVIKGLVWKNCLFILSFPQNF